MENKNAMVLLSGGLDSAVAAAYLPDKGYAVKAGIFVNRGQSNYEQEFKAAQKVSEYLNIPLYNASFSLPDLGKTLSKDMVKKVGIPARNFILGTLALPYIFTLDCGMLVLGNITEDVFPDCNPEFRSKFSVAASQALGREVTVIAPLADWENFDKAGEISYAEVHEYRALFGMTWTCWRGGEFHCGQCDACESRKEGFSKAGVIDPVPYEDKKWIQ